MVSPSSWLRTSYCRALHFSACKVGSLPCVFARSVGSQRWVPSACNASCPPRAQARLADSGRLSGMTAFRSAIEQKLKERASLPPHPLASLPARSSRGAERAAWRLGAAGPPPGARRGAGRQRGQSLRCTTCGEAGHGPMDCPEEESVYQPGGYANFRSELRFLGRRRRGGARSRGADRTDARWAGYDAAGGGRGGGVHGSSAYRGHVAGGEEGGSTRGNELLMDESRI